MTSGLIHRQIQYIETFNDDHRKFDQHIHPLQKLKYLSPLDRFNMLYLKFKYKIDIFVKEALPVNEKQWSKLM